MTNDADEKQERTEDPLEKKLHDEIDLREELQERAHQIVEDTLANDLAKALKETGDILKAMELVVLWVENDLADLSTEAVQKSFKVAKAAKE